MRSNSIIKSLLLSLLASCSILTHENRQVVTLQDLHEDPGICVYSKLVWHTSLVFLLNNDGDLEKRGYIVVIDKTSRNVGVFRTDFGPNFNESEIKNAYSCSDFKKVYDNKENSIFRDALIKINKNFFDISNHEKIEALESFILTQQKVLSKD